MTQNLALKSADPFFFRPEQKASDRWIALGDWAKRQFIASAVLHADEIGINARYASHIQLLWARALDSSYGFKGHSLGVPPFLAPVF
jgi:hypothetical protein